MSKDLVSFEKRNALKLRMEELGIKDADLEEKFVLGSGSGGQKKNKTSSCVVLKHMPTDIVVKSQKSRSRENNRFFARRILCERLEKHYGLADSPGYKRKERIRKQRDRRRRRSSSDLI